MENWHHFPIDFRTAEERDRDELCENHENHCDHETNQPDGQVTTECCLCRGCPCERAMGDQ